MSEFLLASLGYRTTDPIDWLTWDVAAARAIETGRLSDADRLSQLQAHAHGRACYLLLPQEQVLVTEVEVPNARRATQSAIPFLLEERLCDEPDRLHFALGRPRDKTRYPVAVIDRRLITEWREHLLAAGIEADGLFADAQSLAPDTDPAASLQLGERLLVHRDPGTALALPAQARDGWQPLLEREGIEPTADEASPLAALAERLSPQQGIDLLQGEFRLRERQSLWRRWRLPAVLALGLIVMCVASLALDNYRLTQRKASLEQRIRSAFHEALPESRRMVNPKAQLQQQLDRLSQRQQGTLLLGLLDRSAPAFAEAGVSLSALHFERSEPRLQLELIADDATAFERLTTLLKERELHTALERVRQDAQRSHARLTLEAK